MAWLLATIRSMRGGEDGVPLHASPALSRLSLSRACEPVRPWPAARVPSSLTCVCVAACSLGSALHRPPATSQAVVKAVLDAYMDAAKEGNVRCGCGRRVVPLFSHSLTHALHGLSPAPSLPVCTRWRAAKDDAERMRSRRSSRRRVTKRGRWLGDLKREHRTVRWRSRRASIERRLWRRRWRMAR